jgi:hypothetical protein
LKWLDSVSDEEEEDEEKIKKKERKRNKEATEKKRIKKEAAVKDKIKSDQLYVYDLWEVMYPRGKTNDYVDDDTAGYEIEEEEDEEEEEEEDEKEEKEEKKEESKEEKKEESKEERKEKPNKKKKKQIKPLSAINIVAMRRQIDEQNLEIKRLIAQLSLRESQDELINSNRYHIYMLETELKKFTGGVGIIEKAREEIKTLEESDRNIKRNESRVYMNRKREKAMAMTPDTGIVTDASKHKRKRINEEEDEV